LEGKEGKFLSQKSLKKSRVPMGTSKKNYKKSIQNFPLRIESITIIKNNRRFIKKRGQCHGQRGGQC
jgi:hypothetical protein